MKSSGDFRECGLIGAVGGTIFYVGYGGDFTAPEEDELYLSINDNTSMCDNNAGTVRAFVWQQDRPHSVGRRGVDLCVEIRLIRKVRLVSASILRHGVLK